MELSKAQLAGFVSLAMIIAGTVTFTVTDSPKVFYCEDRDIVLQCNSLSDTAKTCYLGDGSSKRCLSVWKPISEFVNISEPVVFLPSGKEIPICSPENKYKVVCRI